MARIAEKIDNLLEYLGRRPKNYYHSTKVITYDPKDALTFYLDPSSKAYYNGPFDPNGIPLYSHKRKLDYLPILICFFALGHLVLYRQHGKEENLSQFLKVVEWLVTKQDRNGSWLTPFPVKKFGIHQPFPSAIAQGAAISCLIRAFLLCQDDRYAESAIRALAPYQRDLREGGVASYNGGHVFYEEYPAEPNHHVLNGFIYAMWGLIDLVRVHSNREAKLLYEEGLKTLIDWLPSFDIGYWSLYHLSEGTRNPATVNYHRLHIAQLDVMYSLTGIDIFQEYRKLWTEYLQNRLNAIRTLPAKLWWHWTYRP